jgi:membrane associated rhomboid family serine protease
MESPPPASPGSTLGEDEQLYCYGHPKTPTRLRCTRCERPICGRCAIPASVGQHCPECVAEARRSAPKVRTVMAATAPGVMTILIINVICFIAQEAVPDITFRFGLVPRAIDAGEWWRLLTPMVLHADIIHILFNSIALFSFGPYVEGAFGTRRFVTLYVASGFFASATSYALGPVNKLGVGASGAIFGMIGVLLVYAFKRRSSAVHGQFLTQLVFIIGLNLWIGFTNPFIDNYAHLGGLFAGMLLGLGFDRKRRTDAEPALQVSTTLAVVGAAVIMVILRSAQLT